MAGASVEIKRFLEWAETDAAGHQHYSCAFRWVEECEAALYRSVGLPSSLFGLSFFGGVSSAQSAVGITKAAIAIIWVNLNMVFSLGRK